MTLTDSVYSHYQIDDLRLALNGKHPLIFRSLEKNEVFNNVEKSIEGLNLVDDGRFRTLVKRGKRSLLIEVIQV